MSFAWFYLSVRLPFTFAGWISYFLLCVIPVQIILAITLGTNHPGFASRRAQPAKGILLVLIGLAVGGIIAAVAASLVKNPLATGFGVLLTSEIGCYLIYKICFNFGFLRGAQVYVAALDPQGLFKCLEGARLLCHDRRGDVLDRGFRTLASNYVSQSDAAAGVGHCVEHYCGRAGRYCVLPRSRSRWNGSYDISGTSSGALHFWIDYCSEYVSGYVVSEARAAYKGYRDHSVGRCGWIAAHGTYGVLAPTVTGTLRTGPPGYDFEMWLASALLAVTFPFLIFIAEFFKLWPFQKT
jgi:hypothetical protein